jgi:hypothetical protein
MQTKGASAGVVQHRRRASRLTLALLLAILAAACGGSVPLLTGRGGLGSATEGMVGCYTSFAQGQLVVDAAYGTAIVENGRATPVMWPAGSTGRQSGSDVEVMDKQGAVVARTGGVYQIAGGYSGSNPRSFVACGYVLPR